MRQDYEPVGIVSAAPMSGDWFHQHFGISKEPLRVSALARPEQPARRARPGVRARQLMDYGAIDISKGGSAIPYHQEDPYLRKEFDETLAQGRRAEPHESGIL